MMTFRSVKRQTERLRRKDYDVEIILREAIGVSQEEKMTRDGEW